MRVIHRLWKEERGSVAILVAAALTAMMGLAALGTDVGRLFVERQRASVVADAAALSGGQRLPADPAGAVASALSNLLQNGWDPANATIAVSSDNRRLTVQLRRQVPMTFARVIGVSESDVGAAATSSSVNLSGYYGAAPLGVPQGNWQLGQQVTLKLDSDGGFLTPGNYQALALGKTGSSTYEVNLQYGYPGWVRLGDWLDTQTGNMATPTVRAVRYRIDLDPDSTWATVSRQSPRLVVVPIVEGFSNGTGQVKVLGFGLFFLEKGYDHGNNKGEIIGRFLRMTVEGEGSTTAPDFGLQVTKLVN